MKQIFLAAVICAAFIGCNSNEANKNEAAVTTTDTMTAATETKAEEKTEAPAPAAPVDSATMMKNWEAYMTPGDQHKMMASWSGKWEGETTMWHAPGASPQTSKSTSMSKMIMGGRYQVSNHTGSMMGTPFEGMNTLAYDNNRKVFMSTWIDNMGTGVMKLEGPWDEATKTMTLKGKCVDPSSGPGGKEMDVRETFRIVDDKSQVMEMYGPAPDGREFKMMEIKFKRQ